MATGVPVAPPLSVLAREGEGLPTSIRFQKMVEMLTLAMLARSEAGRAVVPPRPAAGGPGASRGPW